MKHLMMTLLVITLATPAAARAETAVCGMATLEDVDVATTLVPIGTVTTGRNGIRDWHVYTSPASRVSKSYLVTVRLNDMLYTGESSGDGFWTFNPGTLVVNDGIYVCVAKDRLRITRPDGGDYSAKIVRAVRGVPSNASAQ